MYELGRIAASEYRTKCAELDEQRANLKTQRPEPVLVRQRTMLATLVEDWDEMTPEERRRVIGTVFAEIYPPDNEGKIRALPREDWKPYMAAVLREPAPVVRWGTERKTGLDAPVLFRMRMSLPDGEFLEGRARGMTPARASRPYALGS